MQSPWNQDDSVVSLEISLDTTPDRGVVCRVIQFGSSGEIAAKAQAWATQQRARFARLPEGEGEEVGYEITGLAPASIDGRSSERRAERIRGPVAETLDRLLARYRDDGQSVHRERVVIDLELDLALTR